MKRLLVGAVALVALGGLTAWTAPRPSSRSVDSTASLAGLSSFFVVGDGSAGSPTVGTSVQFWGAQWAKDNSLSGGPAPNSFKGYADNGSVSIANGVCNGEWFSDPGNSSSPPPTLASPFVVILTSTVVKSGPVISGDVVGAVLVTPDPGYEPDPGHAGTGTIQEVLCPTSGSGSGSG